MIVSDVLRTLWLEHCLPADALTRVAFTGPERVVHSSFHVDEAAQASIAAAALAAAEVRRARNNRAQDLRVDSRATALECSAYFSVDGVTPEAWDKYSGLYPCADGFVRLHTNFVHHRDGALKLLGLTTAAERKDVEAAIKNWRAEEFETAAAEAKLVVSAARSFAQWDAHPHARAIAELPLLMIEKIGEADPIALRPLSIEARPLTGVRVLDLTRILAGPVAGRTLAAYGADVMLVNSPNLPNIDAIADTSRGKLSAHIDLATSDGRSTLKALTKNAHVFVQGYRPGGVAALGFAPEDLAALRPGIVCVSLSAYGQTGPWAGKRGFDSLVQTATGFNVAEAEAFGAAQPKAMPFQVLDYATGFLMAFGAQAALLKQQREGGSYLVRVSLAQTARWLRNMGRKPLDPAPPKLDFAGAARAYPSRFGTLKAMPHAAEFSQTPWEWVRPSSPPGSDPPAWPG